MENKCPCDTRREHTEQFDKIYAAIFNELQQRAVPGSEEAEELSKALSVLVADALDLEIYR